MSADKRLEELGIVLPPVPVPLGAYVEAVRSGNLLFVSGTLSAAGQDTRIVGRVGEEVSVEDGREAARIAGLNALSIVRHHLGSLDKVVRVVRLGVSIATSPGFREHPKVADGASELLVAVFGEDRVSTRLVLGVVSLPLGLTVELETIFEVAD
jgi:enamine deaminase RidA (YjgF/YER057c/UK114 family)